MFVAKKTIRNFGSIKWCIVCAPKPGRTTGTSRQRNRTKPPRNLVLGLNKWIGQVCCEKQDATSVAQSGALYAPKNLIVNGYLPATESHETTQKLSFGPKEVDWACSLRKKQDATSEAQSGALYAPKTPISQQVPPGNGIARNHPKLSFGPQEVDWACSLRKNKTQLRKHKVVHFMHPKTRYNNLYLPATESRETTQKHCFGPKEVDWACSLRKK